MQDKPFLTIDEQVQLLASRGVAVDKDTADILLREGYYSVVNGYKDPFIDPEKTAEAGDDRFAEGTYTLCSSSIATCVRRPFITCCV